MGSTFGLPTLVMVDAKDVTPDTVSAQVEEAAPKMSLLLLVRGEVNEKKFPATVPIHGAYRTVFQWPSPRHEQRKLAARFVVAEAARLTGQKKNPIDLKLAKSLVRGVGTDLGVLAFEVSKAAALSRSEGSTSISVKHIRATVRGSSDADMAPLREALASADEARTAKALAKIRSKSATDPTMLLLRARGGPADLAYQWLQVALLLKQGHSERRIATIVGVPDWAVRRDLIPAAKRWGVKPLRELVTNLAATDRGLLKGIPAPWVACVASLLQGCRSVAAQ
jgi:hypothetical protein